MAQNVPPKLLNTVISTKQTNFLLSTSVGRSTARIHGSANFRSLSQTHQKLIRSIGEIILHPRLYYHKGEVQVIGDQRTNRRGNAPWQCCGHIRWCHSGTWDHRPQNKLCCHFLGLDVAVKLVRSEHWAPEPAARTNQYLSDSRNTCFEAASMFLKLLYDIYRKRNSVRLETSSIEHVK